MKRAIASVLFIAAAAFSTGAAEIAEGQVGKRVTGWDGVFNVSFLHVGQHSVTGMARIVIDPVGSARPVDVIGGAYFKYRWRRLADVETDQAGREEWKSIFMVKSGNDMLMTMTAIEVPDFECDLEFYFVGTQNIPYYNFVDYSGVNAGTGGYTEKPPFTCECHLDIPSSEVLGNCGREWFVRVRCGESDVKEARIR